MKVGNSEINWREDKNVRWDREEKAKKKSMECSLYDKQWKEEGEKLVVPLRREKKYIGRTAKDKRIGFPDNL